MSFNESEEEIYSKAAELGRLLAQQLDAAVRSAVTRRLHCNDWRLEDVMPRMRRVIRRDGVEVWILDDLPLLEVWPPQTTHEGDKVRFSTKLKTHTCES